MVQRRLLAILAHPDDESFGLGGTLAKYARTGVDVHVCTVTDGAAGSYDAEGTPSNQRGLEPVRGPKLSLAEIRRQELRCACKILGVHLHTLSYRDSGMEGAKENQHPHSLYQADMDMVAQELVQLVQEVRPQVVITHDPSGGYFHPDHIKVNQAVCSVWEKLVAADPDRGTTKHSAGLWQPARLYYTAIPRSSLKWFVRVLRLLRQDPRRFGQNKDIDLTAVGVPDEQIHVRLDVRRYVSIKEEASACHRSQGGGGSPRFLPRFVRNRFFGHEFFVQAQPPGPVTHRDLFEGLALSS
jgi:LmbE family N-acetylglucosaminyl deacetylase